MQIEFCTVWLLQKYSGVCATVKLNFLELSLHMVQTQGVEDGTSKQRVFLVVLTTFWKLKPAFKHVMKPYFWWIFI